MHAWEAVDQSLNFIEEHLKEEISTEYLADSVGLSPFYFQRLFRRLVKKPIQEYIKLRRLARAIEALQNSGQRILDIALEYGFPAMEISRGLLRKPMELHPMNIEENCRCSIHLTDRKFP